MDEKKNAKQSRLEIQGSRKNARAEKLVREFTAKLRSLAGNNPIPLEWKKIAIHSLESESLARFIARYTRPEKRLPRKRGRPAAWLSENKPARLVNSIDSIKAELSKNQVNRITDKDAIRHWILTDYPRMKDYELRKTVESCSKLLSRSRPAHQRRPKRKSPKSRS